MFLSIIIPVYNVERFLTECLDSCLAQDLSTDDYEIICVDDGSSDNSNQILSGYQRLHSNIRVFTQVNQGVSSARNKGLDLALGKFVWFVDSDDRIIPNAIGRLKILAEKGRYDRIEFAAYMFQEQLISDELERIDSGTLIPNISLHDSSVVTSILATELIRENHIRFRDIDYGEDVVFMLEYMAHCCNKHVVSDVMYLYRTNPNSVTHTSTPKANLRRIESYYNGAVILKDFYNREIGSHQSCGNALMTFIWYGMIRVAQLPHRDKREWLLKFREAGLFPLKPVPEYTNKKAYVTNRTDIIGKLYDYLTSHSHTNLGFFFLRLWYKGYNLRNFLYNFIGAVL